LEAWTEVTDEQTRETTGMTLTLPDWLYRGIVTKGGVLTIHEDYFLLTGGISRWLYRVARKHAGTQELGWQFTMRQLFEKSGSTARFSDFALDVRKVVEADGLPEYALALHHTDQDEVVTFIPRIHLPASDPRFQPPRNPRRRVGLGITAPALCFADTAE
jgi:plasmid replication initiation protein